MPLSLSSLTSVDDKLESFIHTPSSSSTVGDSLNVIVVEAETQAQPAIHATELLEERSISSSPSNGLVRTEQAHQNVDTSQTASTSTVPVHLLHQRLQALSAPTRSITPSSPVTSTNPHSSFSSLRAPFHAHSNLFGGAQGSSSGTRTPASPPATTSQAASLRLQDLARSLQAQTLVQREQERLNLERERRQEQVSARTQVRIFDRFPTGVEFEQNDDNDDDDVEDEEVEEDEDEGDVISFRSGNDPSQDLLRQWLDTRNLEMGKCDADGVMIKRKRTVGGHVLVGR